MHVYEPGEVLTATELNRSVNPLVAIKTANEIVNNSDTVQDDDELVITPETNSTYMVQCFLIYSSTTATPDIKFGFSFPVGANFSWAPIGVTPANANQDATNQAGYIRSVLTTSTATRTVGTMATAEPLVAAPIGLLTMGSTGGDLTLQWAQSTATVENTTLRAGSYIVARNIG
jgi:hypothetical protein